MRQPSSQTTWTSYYRQILYLSGTGPIGQIRPVPYLELRMKEIAKMGYQRVIIPKQGKLPEVPNLAVIEIQTVDELLELIREG